MVVLIINSVKNIWYGKEKHKQWEIGISYNNQKYCCKNTFIDIERFTFNVKFKSKL